MTCYIYLVMLYCNYLEMDEGMDGQPVQRVVAWSVDGEGMD